VSGQVIAAPSFSPILQDEELADLLGGRHHLILGITGTVASGETALAQYFHEEHGYHMLSLATPVYEEARRRGLPITLPNLQDVGNDLRHTYGAGVLVDRLRSEIQRLPRDANLILMAIKNPGEVAALREWQNFRLIAIDAPADRRFAWAQLSDTFGIYGSRQAFDRIDARDCGIDEPPWGQNVTACIAEADYSIQNGANGEMRAKFDACYAWVRKELV
jgi:dephospho-CoA kinase